MSGVYDDDFEAEDDHKVQVPPPQESVVVVVTNGSNTQPPLPPASSLPTSEAEQQQQHHQEAAPIAATSSSNSSVSSSTPSSSDNNNVGDGATSTNPAPVTVVVVAPVEQQPHQEKPTAETTITTTVISENNAQAVATSVNNITNIAPTNSSTSAAPVHAKIGLSCPRCGCMIFGGARLQIASVVLPDCQDCKKMGYGEYFYNPPKISPDDTRGAILKKKNAEALKVQIEEKRLRTLNHAKMQMLMMEEYVSRQRQDKCTKVHKNEQVKNLEDEEKAKKEKEEIEKQERKAKRLEQRQQEAAAARGASSSSHISNDAFGGGSVQFDPSTVTTSNIHGAALASADGDSLRKIATDEAKRLNVSLPALLAIPGYVDLKGRRLGVKRVGTRYELGFGFSATPLHFATLACRADLVATLLDMGADPLAAAGPSSIHRTTANASTLSPTSIDLAKVNGFSTISSLLDHAVKESAKMKFSQYCEKKLAAAGERVRERTKREGASAGFVSPGSKQRAVNAAHAAAEEQNDMSDLKFFPVFHQLRFEPETATTDSIEVPTRDGRFAKLISFNGVEAAKIIAEAKKELGEANAADKDLLSEHIRIGIADIALRLRVQAEGSAIQMPEHVKTHAGFVAKVLISNPANPIQTKEKDMKVVAHSREGADENKKLLQAMFEAVITAAARLDCAPEKLGALLDSVCPEDPHGAGGAHADLGAAMGDAMGQVGGMMGQMMGGLASGLGGGAAGGNGGAGPECKQQ